MSEPSQDQQVWSIYKREGRQTWYRLRPAWVSTRTKDWVNVLVLSQGPNGPYWLYATHADGTQYGPLSINGLRHARLLLEFGPLKPAHLPVP